jgi:hypothetical protein
MKLRDLVPNSYIHVSGQFHFLEYINWILFAVRREEIGPTKDESKNTADLLQYIYSLCGVPAAACGPKRFMCRKPPPGFAQYFARKGSLVHISQN